MYIMLFNTKMDMCMLKLPMPLCTWSITRVPHTEKDGLCYINIKVSYGFHEFRLNYKYQSYDKSSTLFISFFSNWTLSNIGGTSRGSPNSNRSWVDRALSTNRGVACCFQSFVIGKRPFARRQFKSKAKVWNYDSTSNF